MACRKVAIPMTLSDLQGHAPNAGLLNAIFRALDPLRYLSLSHSPQACWENIFARHHGTAIRGAFKTFVA